MGGRTSYVRVGLLIVAGVALLVGLVWFLRGGQLNNGLLLETYFQESVQGLEVGSQVKYRGVTVGRVTQVGIVSALHGTVQQEVNDPLYREVYVDYVVDPSKFGKQVPTLDEVVGLGLRARLTSQLITGLSYIDLDFVDPATNPVAKLPWKPEAAYVPSMPSTFAQVQNAAAALVAKLNQVDIAKLVTSLTALSVDLDRELASGDVHDALTAGQGLLATANQAVKTADLPGLTANLRQTSDTLRGVARDPNLKKMLTEGAVTTDHLAELTGRMSTLVTGLEATVRHASSGTSQLQAGIAPLVRNMQAASENLRELTASLRSYPGQLLSSPPPPTRGPLQ